MKRRGVSAPSAPLAGEQLELGVEAFDDEGRGRGTASLAGELFDVAVRGAFPGDRVLCQLERVFAARGLAQARALNILERGPLHVPRACPHRSPCPGCPLEGALSSFALDAKRERVVTALADVGISAAVASVEPSRGPRQKVKLTVGGQAGALRLGLFVPHSHDLVGAEACPHQHPAITRALGRLQRALNATGLPPATVDRQGVKAVIVRAFLAEGRPQNDVAGVDGGRLDAGGATSDDAASHTGAHDHVDGPRDDRIVTGAVVVTGAALDDATFEVIATALDRELVSLAVRVDDQRGNSLVGGAVQRAVGPQHLVGLEGGAPVSVDAFCQTDPELAAWLYDRAAAFVVGSEPEGTFVDAYAGTGGFSRALLARGARAVIAVERAGASASALASLPVEALASSVEDALPALAARGPLTGLVVDPPKAGLKEAAAPLAQLGARRIALIACDPDAGARDAKVLLDAGYTLRAVEPLDLFPATPEVETLLLFSI